MATMFQFWVFVLMHVCYGRNHIASDQYLTDYQNSTLILPVDCSNGLRAGSILLFPNQNSYPQNGFFVNITLPTTCVFQYKLYFNIKKLNLNDVDLILISERPYGIRKVLDGGQHWPFYNPTSVAQYAALGNSIDITFRSGFAGYQQYSDSLTLDYSVMHLDYYSRDDDENYCSALSSSQLKNLMCSDSDRVVCPTTYNPDPETTNPVISKDNYGCPTGMDPSTVVALCSVSAFFVIGILATAIVVHQRRRSRFYTYQSLVQPACEDDHVQAHNVTSYGAIPTYPNHSGVFAGPPPSYTDLNGPAGNHSTNGAPKT